jgi:hypothetical protein
MKKKSARRRQQRLPKYPTLSHLGYFPREGELPDAERIELVQSEDGSVGVRDFLVALEPPKGRKPSSDEPVARPKLRYVMFLDFVGIKSDEDLKWIAPPEVLRAFGVGQDPREGRPTRKRRHV